MKHLVLVPALAVSLAIPALVPPAFATDKPAPQATETVRDAAPAAAANAREQAFSLPRLPYAFNALEPVIDAATMETHYSKHHQAYVDKLNAEVAKSKALQGKTLEEILAVVSNNVDNVRNNAGGHWNHSFYWKIMAPKGKTGEPSKALKDAIDQKFGSMEKFEAAFEKAGTERFGSGWVWLLVNRDGELEITSTPNQDNPLMDIADVKGTPIIGNDLWEHAYYLKYRNKRADYLKKWWQVVNWTQASKNFENATKKKD